MSRLEWALKLAAMGFKIAPLSPGSKKPYKDDPWRLMATTDVKQIREWFATRKDMNYLVNPTDGAFILDPDMDASKGKDGLAMLQEFQDEQYEGDFEIIGKTFTVRSPRGGNHLYFLTPYPISNSRGEFPVGIDVRGNGGYVVGPGSHTTEDAEENTAEGDYEVIVDAPIMEAPGWVLDKLSKRMERDEQAEESLIEWDLPNQVAKAEYCIKMCTTWPTSGQGGDENTYVFVTRLREMSISPEKCMELLNAPLYDDGASWNERCDPPWDLPELQVKIDNAYAYAKNRPGSKGGLLDSLDDAGQEYVSADAPAIETKTVADTLESLYWPGDRLLERNEKREYVIPEWILAHGMTQLLAIRGAGKTVTMLDMALRIACDMDWQGIPIAKDWAVVYACGEDDLGLQEQMRAWCMVNEIAPFDDRFIVMTATPNLMKAPEVEAWTRFLLKKLNGRKAVLFVDTWQRATATASQNDEEQMQLATDHAEAMAKSLKGPCVIAFHPPKGNGDTISGSMVIENKGSAVLKLTKEANHRKLLVTRIKGPGEGNYRRFHFDVINLGEKDAFGKERTGVVPRSFAEVVVEADHEVESPELKALENQAGFYYASLIRELYQQAEEEEDPKERMTRFSLRDTAARIFEFHEKNRPHQTFRKMRAMNEFIGNFDTIRKRLADLFEAGKSYETDEQGIYVRASKKGISLKFTLDSVPG